jgi:hypothetical protein
MSKEGYLPVYRAMDENIANIIVGVLDSAGIPAVVESTCTWAYDGVLGVGAGYYGDVLVPEDRAEEALDLLADYNENDENEENKGSQT